MNNVSEFEAIRKWNNIPKQIRERLLKNVYCPNCFETTFGPTYHVTYEEHSGSY